MKSVTERRRVSQDVQLRVQQVCGGSIAFCSEACLSLP